MIPAAAPGMGGGTWWGVGGVGTGVSLRIFINDLKDRGKQHANETCR